MKRLIAIATLFTLFQTVAHAQQGHPLSGTWQGEWGTSASDQHFLTLIMEWDGQRITGIANPGPDSTPIDQVTLSSDDWSVDIDMDMKDSASRSVRFKGEGTLSDLGSQTRSLQGKWSSGSEQGTFTLTRQSGP
jgi:hypothetical protein